MSDDLTLEKLKISERLQKIEETMIKFMERFDAHTIQDHESAARLLLVLERHDRMLLGINGSDGMKLDIDRLKQRSSATMFIMGGVAAAVIGLVVRALWMVLSSAHGI